MGKKIRNKVRNKMKGTSALLLSVIMIFAMGTTVSAAEIVTQKGRITITEDMESTNTAGNTYAAYKIADTVDNGVDSAGNAVYTYEINPAFVSFFENGQKGYLFTQKDGITTTDGIKIATDTLSGNTNTSAASAFASAAAKYARESGINGTDVSAAGGVEAEYGYYVIAETASAENTAVASKPILAEVKGELVINPKDSEIDIEKKIVENGQKTDANHVNIGDVISFEVHTAIPVYEADVDRTKLKYTLTDTFTNMDFADDSLLLLIDGKEMIENQDYTLKKTENGFLIELAGDVIYENQGAEVKLTYNAVLNKDAVADSTDGNVNQITLEYTNNPNQENSFDVIEDETRTFTYGFKLHKTDKHDGSRDMEGAQFAIKNEAGEVIGSFTYGKDGEIEAEDILIATDGNYASISGLDAGKYTIEETKAPNGYAMLDAPFDVTITDKGEMEGGLPNGIAQIETEGHGKAEDDRTENGDKIIDLVIKVENVRGISLPETGDVTALYSMLGGGVLLVLGGVYFAVTRKRRTS